jgi:light-regulated signal transduction histidine kinase (bacteriophytochrome)
MTDSTHSLWLLDTFLAVLALTGLLLAAVVRERDQAAAQNAALASSLQRNVTELEFTNAELEAFTYSVSHDLRAPLRNIDGFARNLDRRAPADLDDECRRYLSRIRANTKAMGTLIDELLALSRLQRQPLQTGRVDVGEVVRQALAQLESARTARPDLTITVEDLPTVSADSGLLVQVYVNLIGNAIKFTRGCTPAAVTVSGSLDAATGEWTFAVSDTGVGFDMAYVDRMFGVFQRLHRMEDYEGSGVGLALVARIVHRHGGRVWAQGAVGGGATIYFTLGGSAS